MGNVTKDNVIRELLVVKIAVFFFVECSQIRVIKICVAQGEKGDSGNAVIHDLNGNRSKNMGCCQQPFNPPFFSSPLQSLIISDDTGETLFPIITHAPLSAFAAGCTTGVAGDLWGNIYVIDFLMVCVFYCLGGISHYTIVTLNTT